jgi:hypothetical protein
MCLTPAPQYGVMFSLPLQSEEIVRRAWEKGLEWVILDSVKGKGLPIWDVSLNLIKGDLDF